MILMIDNFDSFTWNLVQYFMQLGVEMQVRRNNEIGIQDIERLNPSHIVLSPGPGGPKDAGICKQVVAHFKDKRPLLGVCLGHQTIGEVFGGTVSHAQKIMHGKTSTITHDGLGIFKGLPQSFTATRYHSLAVLKDTVPQELLVTAQSEDGEIMGLRHKEFPIHGVQFHPESVLSEHGHAMLKNFIQI